MTKQYWLKIISDIQLDTLKDELYSGMSWNSMEKVRKVDPDKTYSTFNAYKEVKNGDEILFKIINGKTIYKGEVVDIEWSPIENREKEYDTGNWAHHFHFDDIQSLGERGLWENKEKITYLKKFKNAGFAHMTGMWKLPKEDFEKIINNFNS